MGSYWQYLAHGKGVHVSDEGLMRKSLFIITYGGERKANEEMALVASLADSYKLELASDVPSTSLERDEEAKRILSINGIVKGQLLNGVCTARYNDNDLNLRYSYRDEHMSFVPSISVPSNVVSFAFKHRFSPSDKLRMKFCVEGKLRLFLMDEQPSPCS